jgi:hypothetical protein
MNLALQAPDGNVRSMNGGEYAMIIRYWNDHDLVLLCLYSEILVLWRMKTGVSLRTTLLAPLSLGEIPELCLSFAEAR